MKAIRKFYFPNLCITFALATIIASVMNITNKNDPTGFHRFIIQFAGVLILIGIVDYYFEKLEFKSWLGQMVMEGLVNYIIFMIAGYFLNWFGFQIPNVISITIIFIAIFVLVMIHSYKLLKQDEAWINHMIEKRHTEGR